MRSKPLSRSSSGDEDMSTTIITNTINQAAFTTTDISDIGSFPSASDTDAIAESQTPAGAGNLTLTASPYTPPDSICRRVTITSDGDDSGVTFTITGSDENRDAQVSDPITGPNADTVMDSTNWWSEITQIEISGAGTGNITAGISDGYILVDYDDGAIQKLSPLSDFTVQVSNWPSESESVTDLILIIVNLGSYTATWDVVDSWVNAISDAQASGKDFILIRNIEGIIYGWHLGGVAS